MNAAARTRSIPEPRVSVGMPVYNGSRWIEDTLQSLRRQTLPDFELIISDNASEDGTEQICRAHAAEDARIRYYRNPRNIGANRNYVAVLDHARAPYFKWASSNDLCGPEFLAACVAALDRDRSAVLAYPRTAVFVQGPADATPYDHDIDVLDDDAGRRFTRVIETMKLNNAINGVIRTDVLREALPMGTFWGADDVLMAELALRGKYLLVGDRLFLRRMSEESATRLRVRAEVEKHFEPDAKGPLKWQTWKYHTRLLRSAARSAPAGRQWVSAVGYALRTMLWARSDLAHELRVARS